MSGNLEDGRGPMPGLTRHHQSSMWAVTSKTSLAWNDVTVEVKDKFAKNGSNKAGVPMKKILKSVSGAVRGGELLAIMGPSGCGKTTLLDILADKASFTSGEVLINKTSRKEATAQGLIVSYVAQEDTLLGAFTTKETLMYTAALTLPLSLGYNGRHARVSTLIDQMGLRVCANTRVGDVFFKGLSGGQKRRLSLALALLGRPEFLLLDEPTSGLDAASALGIMRELVKLVNHKNMCIVATIHQPSSEIWSMFDKLCLLSAGNTIYFGKAASAIRYFNSIGHPCPEFSNPADYFLALINMDFDGHADVDQLAENWKQRKERRNSGVGTPVGGRETPVDTIQNDAMAKLDDDIDGEEEEADEEAVKAWASHRIRTPIWWQFLVLCHRNFLNTFRNPGIVVVRLVMYTMLGIMIGGMFYRNGVHSTDKALQGRQSCFYYIFAFMIFMSIAVLPFYAMDRSTYLRERFNGDFEVLPFVAAQWISNMPGVFLISLCASVPIVYLMYLANFEWFLLFMFLALMVAEGLMAFLSAIVPHFIIGIALGAGIYGFFMLCQGFFQVRSDIPPWFIWVYFMGFHTYVFRGAMINEFEGRGTLEQAENPNWQTGKDVLKYFGMDANNKGDDAWTLFGYMFAWQLCYYLALKLTTGKRKRA